MMFVITDAMVAAGDALAASIARAGIDIGPNARGNYSGLCCERRFEKGYVGEIGAVDVLRANGIWCEHIICPNGRAQGPEVIASMNGTPLAIDVKTAGEISHRYCMLPEEQWQKDLANPARHFAYVLAVQLDMPMRRGYLRAYARWTDMASWGVLLPGKRPAVDVPTRLCRFVDMGGDVPELLARLDRA